MDVAPWCYKDGWDWMGVAWRGIEHLMMLINMDSPIQVVKNILILW